MSGKSLAGTALAQRAQHSPAKAPGTGVYWRHGQHVLIAQLFLSLSLNCRVVHFAASLEQPFGRMQCILPFSPAALAPEAEFIGLKFLLSGSTSLI